jgi:DNA modification methylase
MNDLQLLKGDCLDLMPWLVSDESVDALVCDPPAGIGFMGKEWDHHKGGRKEWIEWMTEIMRECLRVMKPGAHGLVWALPRTSHWTATALEDAGFEVRDVVTHLFGSGFPKSLDVSKAIDKAAGAERAAIGANPNHRGESQMRNPYTKALGQNGSITAPATDAVKQWQGWGTALKPASEHWILIRKPCSEKTVAANVLKWGCGALNIDASRIGFARAHDKAAAAAAAAAQRSCRDQNDGRTAYGKFENGPESLAPYLEKMDKGRFPANLILSHTPYCTDAQCDIECAVKGLDEQSRIGKSKSGDRGIGIGSGYHGTKATVSAVRGHDDSGGASRFFYCAKTSKAERNAGLDELTAKKTGIKNASGRGFSESDPYKEILNQNHHPTVKPKKLMTYLIRMVTPPGGTVLDPFMGSGSTGVAARDAGFKFIGIEKEEEYFEIAKKRIGESK